MSQFERISSYLSQFGTADGIYGITTDRTYRIDKAANASHWDKYLNLKMDPVVGRSRAQKLETLLGSLGVQLEGGGFLEVGCGTGQRTFPWLLIDKFDFHLVTDGMEEFVRLARAKCTEGGAPSNVLYATMDGDSSTNLPDDIFSVIGIFAALHHILDWERFLADMSGKLARRGAIVAVEPLAEFSIAAHLLLKRLVKADLLDDAQIKGAKQMLSAWGIWLSRDLEKARYEDKHNFSIHEMQSAASRIGLDFHYVPGGSVENVSSHVGSFSKPFFAKLDRLKLSDGQRAVVQELLADDLAFHDEMVKAGHGPFAQALFVLRRPE